MTDSQRAFEAVRAGDDQLLAQMLDEGLLPDSVDEDGDSLLGEAAFKRHLNCVRLLLAKGARPNGPQNDGSPLWKACYRPNNAECMRKMIEHGGDPNRVQDRESKQTMLMHCAASPLDKRNFAELLKHSPNLDARNDEDESPLSYACTWGNLRAVKMLLDAGVDPNARVCKGSTALSVALTSHNRTSNAIVHYLIDRGGDVNIPDVDPADGTPYKNPLMFAVSYRGESPADVALARRIALLTRDLNFKIDGETALSMALKNGYTEYVEMLNELGAAEE